LVFIVILLTHELFNVISSAYFADNVLYNTWQCFQ